MLFHPICTSVSVMAVVVIAGPDCTSVAAVDDPLSGSAGSSFLVGSSSVPVG